MSRKQTKQPKWSSGTVQLRGVPCHGYFDGDKLIGIVAAESVRVFRPEFRGVAMTVCGSLSKAKAAVEAAYRATLPHPRRTT